ncbi:hypothetical protein SAMN04515671_3771 [Nakamurella panacisegetis]|uniref:Uncharacterized protein n=1 Tax=Nakamurella panacisegetis TaxID=1090615 RepID=A0A1H0RV90_9ACTN|nr:hypothetical protein SAMN04515671_3771 [Nakamurella panacisegetis]
MTLQLPQPAQATATAPASTAPRYNSSIRNALHTGQQRDQLGICTPALDWNGDQAIDCSQPHALEYLAYGDSGIRSAGAPCPVPPGPRLARLILAVA